MRYVLANEVTHPRSLSLRSLSLSLRLLLSIMSVYSMCLCLQFCVAVCASVAHHTVRVTAISASPLSLFSSVLLLVSLFLSSLYTLFVCLSQFQPFEIEPMCPVGVRGVKKEAWVSRRGMGERAVTGRS